ncbi:oxygenase MpaB family protein [Desertivirga arenae]|uniref:oxygenase MpaB family protein n=1 Tax=Desertivirga arenae TaxID=2810309 RepID=UPI001A96C04C|nr:oxygenase MpaB family protein [Pedobacter sp. SYSU D00823]
MPSAYLYTDNFLSDMREVGDPLADDFIYRSFSDNMARKEVYDWLGAASQNADLQNLPLPFATEKVFTQAQNLPTWADDKLLSLGCSFFSRYQNSIMQLLGLLSLPYCYAAADGAMVLFLSERLRNDTPKRLADTGEFVTNVQSPGAFAGQGRGFIGILKTRLTHAIARYYTLKSGKWNDKWGVPVNQEDMVGTGLAFSLIVIRGLRKTGITINDRDQQAFLHLWAVISYLLGVDERLIPRNGKAANQLEKAIRVRQFKESIQGKELTNSLIETFTSLDSGSKLSRKDVQQLMTHLLGAEVSTLLGLSVEPRFHTPYLLKIFSTLSSWNPYLKVQKPI